MLETPIQRHWLDAFVDLFTLCKAHADERVLIFAESHSRPVNVMLAELALRQMNVPFEVIRTG